MTEATLTRALPRTEAQDALSRIITAALFLSLAQAAIVPNSFQLAQGLSFVVTAALCVVAIRRDPWLDRVLLTFCAGTIVTAIYIWVGSASNAPRAASNQTLFVYIIAPLLWIVMGTALFQYVGIRRATQWLIWLTAGAVVSVALFFWAFLTFGRSAVLFLNSEANVNVNSGFAGANILVYGSLIFLAGALFAQPDIVRGRWTRLLLPAIVFLTALTSGRSALMLAPAIGYGVGALTRGRMATGEGEGARRSLVAPTILLALGALVVIAIVDFFVESVDVLVIFDRFWDEVASGGGSERTEQAAALWEGVMASNGLGVGHGIGVSYLRSHVYPWRYEVLPLATLLRVGFVGAAAYCSTFAIYVLAFLRKASRRQLLPEDVYMMGGFACVFLALLTNPYPESFVFQWMYLIPVMSLAVQPLARYVAD